MMGDKTGCGVMVARVPWADLVRVQVSAPRIVKMRNVINL